MSTTTMASIGQLAPHQCEHCQRIILDQPIKEENYGIYNVTIPHLRHEVLEAVEAGCPLFSLYPMLPSHDSFTSGSLDPAALEPFFNTEEWLKFPGWQQRTIAMLAEAMLDPHSRPYEVFYDTEGDFGLRCLSWRSQSDTMRIVAEAGSAAAEDTLFRPINWQVDSDEVFEFLRRQLSECCGQHCDASSCSLPSDDFSPRRLIRIIREHDTFHLYLYEPGNGEHVQWCALSYCWGGQDQGVKTTIATLPERLKGIDFTSLPKTLRDAVVTTSRLNLEYIWIDSLCILQDSHEEKTEDITQMDRIYSHAYITISASSASSVTEGFLDDRQIPQSMTPISMRYLTRSGVESNLRVCAEPTPRDIEDPINTRGWTFQERVLSPRLIDFSTTQVRWRCQSLQATEAGCPAESVWANHFATSFIVSASNPLRSEGKDDEREWSHLVSAYSSRNLTYGSDKLIAFSAIPRALGRAGQYLAGLWEIDLPCNLLWKVVHDWSPASGTTDKRKPRPREYRAPSWSWASVDGDIRCDNSTMESKAAISACHVLDIHTQLSDTRAPFGGVVSGYLLIQGFTRQAKFLPAAGQLFFVDEGTAKRDQEHTEPEYGAFADCLPDKQIHMEEGQEESVDVVCLHIRNYGGRGEGLILVEDANESVFRRIGHFYWSKYDNDSKFITSTFQYAEETLLKIV